MFPYCCFELNVPFVFSLQVPSTQDCSIIDCVSDSIDLALASYPSANIIVLGDFNAHHTEWLNSVTTDTVGIHSLKFSISQNLTQVIDFLKRFPDNSNSTPSLLDLCLVSDPNEYSVSCHSPLGSSDHALISLTFRASSTVSESPYHRTTYNYQRADWDSFLLFLRDAPWSKMFSLSANKSL